MSLTRQAIIVGLALVALVGVAAAAESGRASSSAANASRQDAVFDQRYVFYGTVTRTDPGHRWVQLHNAATNKLLRFRTSRATLWGNCDWGEMHPGHTVAIRAERGNGSWSALRINDWHHMTDDHHNAGDD